jgi:hypothetical protein
LEVFNAQKDGAKSAQVETEGMFESVLHQLVNLTNGEREERVFYLKPSPKGTKEMGLVLVSGIGFGFWVGLDFDLILGLVLFWFWYRF